MSTFGDKDSALETFVADRVAALQKKYLRDDPQAVAIMARLRRAVATPAGSRPDIWKPTLGDLPESLTDPREFRAAERDGAPTAWEQAAHDAITLHAWHQQSRPEPMHRRGASFGAALNTLGRRTEAVDAVRRRFHVLGTAQHRDLRMTSLRALLSQLRTQAIPVDYGRLARDLRRLGDRATATGVLLQWGRDYHRNEPDTGTDDLKNTTVKGDSE
ncbi:type I-E CRISPR-associated protein Cse2/CasB [Nocardia sp. alder85J]|uniref:type I-E CRISPR-associated protein Cse2/CasB n=1 Tax=Nocardia sp. alder85J TaxID=2862949 RepID=UPI001CD1E653|nr:type I-E CRISPR-associated protein Cse2/CasB [Nocardia sp. alder85J]MCX4097900.1 type I-E CRISPR-associated protein Cse2/CasB [Nocardia sp. alder85J]